MKLAEQLIETTPDHSLTLFDRGFYSLGLLHQWQQAGVERHWLMPLRKGAQYEVIQRLGRQDAVFHEHFTTGPQAMAGAAGRNQRTTPEQNRQGQGVSDPDLNGRPAAASRPTKSLICTASAGDRIRLSGNEADAAQQQLYVACSDAHEMIEQELWGVLLGYNICYQMVEMSHCPGIYPCEMSFTACTGDPRVYQQRLGRPLREHPQVPGRAACLSPTVCTASSTGGARLPRAIELKSPKYRSKIKMPVSAADWH